MSNNFRRTAVLKKYEMQAKASLLRILLQNIDGVTFARRPRTKFPGKITDKYMENLKQVRPQNV